MKKILILGTLCLWSYHSSGQGLIDGYMRGKGNLTVALSYTHESYDHYYVGSQATQNPNLGTITTQSGSLFLAGGITNHLDVVANIPYIRASPSAGFWSTQSDFQDLSFFLRYLILKKEIGSLGDFSLLTAAGLSTPLTKYIPDAPVAIGHQSTNTELRLLAQQRLPFGMFVMAQVGYIRRSNVTIDRGYEVSVPDAWDYILRTGGSVGAFYVDAWFNVQQARSGTDLGPGVPFPSNAVSFTRVGFNVFYHLPWIQNMGLGAGMGFTLAGKNIGRATRISGAVVYNLNLLQP